MGLFIGIPLTVQRIDFMTMTAWCSAGTSNATPERIFSRVTWQSRGCHSYMSILRLDEVVRIQELGKTQPHILAQSAEVFEELR